MQKLLRKNTKREMKTLNKVRKVFTKQQVLVLEKTSTKGFEWDSETIKRALQLNFSCGRCGYETLLEQNFPLPSLRTLRRRLECIPFNSGVLDEVFDMLETKVNSMAADDRDCCLTLDEMKTTGKVEYDKSSDKYVGYVTLPGHSGSAEHGLVFMLSGIRLRWKQVVAYYFTGNSVNGKEFKAIIVEIIKKAHAKKLNVLSVTSDMGSANRAMWKSFGVGVTRKKQVCSCVHPCDENKQLYFLADPPHALKNLRNFIISGQTIELPKSIIDKFSLPSTAVTVEPVRKLYEAEASVDIGIKMAPKLTAKVIQPGNFVKMNVGKAMIFFSKPVEAGIRTMVADEGWDKIYLTSCWFFSIIRQWFSLMNSRHFTLAISKANVDEYNKTIELLKLVIEIFQNSKMGPWKPIQTAVILSTLSVLKLQEVVLNDGGDKFLLTSRLSQDCLENLFSSVRIKTPIPSALEFKRNLRIICVSQYLKVPENCNYDVDESIFLAEFLLPARKQLRKLIAHVDDGEPCMLLINNVCTTFDTELKKSELNGLKYIAGYCVSEELGRCDVCDTFIRIENTESANDQEFVIQMEFKSNKKSLKYAKFPLLKLLKNAEGYFKTVESQLSHQIGLKERLVNTMITCDKTVSLFPTCHDIAKKLLSRFFTIRVNSLALKLTAQNIAQFGSSMSSKSAAMHEAVSK